MQSDTDSAIKTNETVKERYVKSNKNRKARIEKLAKEINELKAEKTKTKTSEEFNKTFRKGKDGKRKMPFFYPYRG